MVVFALVATRTRRFAFRTLSEPAETPDLRLRCCKAVVVKRVHPLATVADADADAVAVAVADAGVGSASDSTAADAIAVRGASRSASADSTVELARVLSVCSRLGPIVGIETAVVVPPSI